MLRVIVLDLRTSQTPAIQDAKSKGLLADVARKVPETAAEFHAVLRAKGGFSIEQLVSEYRALRASVLRLYGLEHASDPDALADIGRFNEAIDQAIAESVKFYSAEVERWRSVFLGVLGHDLRGPLHAILTTSQVIARLGNDEPVSVAAKRLIRSGERMRELLDDLLDFNRTSLELGIPVDRQESVLETICSQEVELRRASHPQAELRFSASGPTNGRWDASRIRQLLGNLVANAVQYGQQGGPVEVRLVGGDSAVELEVRNHGSNVSRETLLSLFDPLRRLSAPDGGDELNHLGLGLFIVREIARAHEGTVDVESDKGVTTFKVYLPSGNK